MSMRINSLLRNETSTITNNHNQHQQITIKQRKRSVTRNSEKRLSKPFYVRSANITHKAASPFRKYEECVKQNSLSNRAQSTPTQHHHHHHNESLIKNVRIEIEPTDSLKIVDNLNKLIIECLGDASNLYHDCGSSSSSNVICYKKNYNFNISDSNFNLFKETNNSESTINNNLINNSVIKNDSVEPSQSPSKQINEEHLQIEKITPVHSTESKKSKISFDEEQKKAKNVKFVTNQLPLGVPENLNQQSLNNDIKLNSETAEKFMNLLITEDEHIRSKLASGQVDSSTLNKLQRLKEMRERYIEYKSQQEKSVEIQGNNDDEHPKSINNQSVTTTTRSETKHQETRVNHMGDMSPSAFSEELKRHPLIQNNNYLRFELI